jgi:hypothetical protein
LVAAFVVVVTKLHTVVAEGIVAVRSSTGIVGWDHRSFKMLSIDYCPTIGDSLSCLD